MEKIELTTPEPYPLPVKTVTEWQVAELHLQWRIVTGGSRLVVELESPEGERREIQYHGEKAIQLMVALNKANLSVKSLHWRIMEYLISDGKINGNITGGAD